MIFRVPIVEIVAQLAISGLVFHTMPYTTQIMHKYNRGFFRTSDTLFQV
jgi:hypothetical protein